MSLYGLVDLVRVKVWDRCELWTDQEENPDATVCPCRPVVIYDGDYQRRSPKLDTLGAQYPPAPRVFASFFAFSFSLLLPHPTKTLNLL